MLYIGGTDRNDVYYSRHTSAPNEMTTLNAAIQFKEALLPHLLSSITLSAMLAYWALDPHAHWHQPFDP